MKKFIYVVILICSFGLAGCTPETENLFEGTSADRIEKELEEAKEVLVSAPNGWVMKYYPSSQQLYGGYNVLASFTKDGSVTISADIVDASQKATSYYKLKEQAGPVLTFDTYNDIFHFFSAPDSNLGDVGTGMGGDYEFTIMSVSAEEIVLKGKKTGNYVRMVPMPEDVSWKSYLEDIVNSECNVDGLFFTYTVNGVEYSVKKSFRTLIISYEVEGESVSGKYPYILTDKGLEFYSPINIAGENISNLFYDVSSGLWKSEDGKVTLKEEFTPSSQWFTMSGPWFVTYDGMSSYGQSFVKKGQQSMSANIGGNYALDYLILGSYFYEDNAVNVIYGAYAGVMILDTSILSDDKVKLTLTGSADETGFALWQAGLNTILTPIVALNEGVTFYVEHNAQVNPLEITLTLTEVGNEQNKIVVTNLQTPFGYHE